MKRGWNKSISSPDVIYLTNSFIKIITPTIRDTILNKSKWGVWVERIDVVFEIGISSKNKNIMPSSHFRHGLIIHCHCVGGFYFSDCYSRRKPREWWSWGICCIEEESGKCIINLCHIIQLLIYLPYHRIWPLMSYSFHLFPLISVQQISRYQVRFHGCRKTLLWSLLYIQVM